MKNKKLNRIIKSGLRMLSRNKIRTFFMMLGIIIGITALTVSLTLGKGIEKKITTNVRKIIRPNNLVITSEPISQEGPRQSISGPNTSLKVEDAETIARSLDGVVNYDYYFTMPETPVSYRGTEHITFVNGCRTQGEQIWNKTIAQGRFFNEMELLGSKRVAVMGPKIAKRLFGNEDPIGKEFRIDNSPFTVIGLIVEQGADPHGNDIDEEITIPITTLMRRVTNVDYIMAIKFEFGNEEQSIAAESTVRQILRERHSLTEGEADDFTLITPVFVRTMIAKVVRVFKVMLPIFSLIALFAGAIVITVLMNMSVNQRIKEVGLRKALGAKDKEISLQFFAESLAVVLIGGILGMVIGLVFSALISDQMNATFYIPAPTIILGLLFSLATGLLAGILPARKAAKLNPVETLKS